MVKQDVTFNKENWSNETKTTSRYVDVKGILLKLFSLIVAGVMFLIATPFFIVIWTMNFLKSLFGMFMFWILGKVSLSALVFLVEFIVLPSLGLADKEIGLGWSLPLLHFFFGSEGNLHPFPHGAIEYWTIFIIALILATVTTIFRDDM